ncbi:MAG TPA: FHA domain-containing protein, partial [Allosphingosinicella sp.]
GGSLDLAPGISFAVASAEIIKAAQDNGIRLLEDASACPEAAAAPSPPPEETQPPARPWYRGPVEFMQSRTGVALLVGLLALIALGTAAWLFFGKSGPARREAEPEPQPDSPRSVTPTGPVLDEAASGALTLTGRGPGGESVNLRFSADELKSSARTLGTEGQAHIPDTRAKTLVSRTHAELSFDGTHFQIQDLKSTNGTKLDGQALAPFEKRRLHDGASIVLADVTLSVRVD